MSRRGVLYVLLIAAAVARLLMQMAALPPYAGLDEIFHVARLTFARAEHRNPTITEQSVPSYLARSIAGDPNVSAAFGVVGPRWPEIVRTRRVVVDQAVDRHPYAAPNYEAQQPSLYYSIAGPLVPARSAMFELRAWRFLSILFALVVVIATASIGERWFGPAGILAGLLVVSLPTWLTLVVRASNDAFACALLAVALAISACAPKRAGVIAEAIGWAGAVAAKLYTWPALVALPFLWRAQRARRARVIAVVGACAVAVVLTLIDLASRTRNPLGLFAFDKPAVSGPIAIRYADMLKILIASFAWSSGQHWDALTPLGIALYLLPVVIAVAIALRRNNAAIAVIVAFALAQMLNAAAYARSAHSGLPAGGKEGWYWYALVPLLVPALLAPAVARFRALAWWIVAWDIVITEVALFHDFAGTRSPAHPTALFRWGPWELPFTAHLDGIAVGPFVSALVLMRLIHVSAFFALQSLSRTHDRPDHLALQSD